MQKTTKPNVRQILFQGAMVRAILDGSKTQTRRAVAMPLSWDCIVYADFGSGWWPYRSDDGESPNYDNNEIPLRCPYGQPGDHLEVRETFFAYGRWETRYSEKKRRDEWHFVDITLECDRAYQYAADSPDVPLATGRGVTPGWYSRPSIFMPRAACRQVLEIVSVRVERLNECSDSDALAEGCSTKDMRHGDRLANVYARLWESINGADSWSANPWVWVVTFKCVGGGLAMRDEPIDLESPSYTPNVLLNRTSELLGAKSDHVLALMLELDRAILCRIRARKAPITAGVMVRIMDRTGWHIQEVRQMAGMPYDGIAKLVMVAQKIGFRYPQRVWARGAEAN